MNQLELSFGERVLGAHPPPLPSESGGTGPVANLRARKNIARTIRNVASESHSSTAYLAGYVVASAVADIITPTDLERLRGRIQRAERRLAKAAHLLRSTKSYVKERIDNDSRPQWVRAINDPRETSLRPWCELADIKFDVLVERLTEAGLLCHE